jgi:branched-subunit amino acid transport protein
MSSLHAMEPGVTDAWTLLVIVGLACVTVVARCFFFLSSRAWSLPGWVQRGLQYAPIAALSAVVLPEVVMAQDARLFAAVAGLAAYAWRRDVLATIVCGMVVYLPLHLGFGW